MDLPGSRLHGYVAAALLLMAIAHEIVWISIGHGQTAGHQCIIAWLLQHLRMLPAIVAGQQCGRCVWRMCIRNIADNNHIIVAGHTCIARS